MRKVQCKRESASEVQGILRTDLSNKGNESIRRAFTYAARAQLQRKNEQPLGSRKRSQAVPRRTSCMMTCARRARTRSCQASAWPRNGRLWRYRRSASSRCAMVARKFRDGRSHARSRTSMWRFTHTRSVHERANAHRRTREVGTLSRLHSISSSLVAPRSGTRPRHRTTRGTTKHET